jgi:hypothetical protein
MKGNRQRSGLPAVVDAKGGGESDALAVHAGDFFVAALTFALGVVVASAALRGIPVAVVALLHALTILVPAAWLVRRRRRSGDLTIPILLLVAVLVSGPLGAGGCAAMTLVLWTRRLDPARLADWYDYIAGVSRRSPAEEAYGDLVSGRLALDVSAPVHRFNPILSGSSLIQQQRVLGAIGRKYHPEFHGSLKKALRNRNILIRAQAAAIASLLGPEDKTRLWQPAALADRPRRLTHGSEREG